MKTFYKMKTNAGHKRHFSYLTKMAEFSIELVAIGTSVSDILTCINAEWNEATPKPKPENRK